MKNGDLAPSTSETYHTVWRNFLNFLNEFKNLPSKYEDKMVMYAAHLGNEGAHSATVGSYMSAIRYKLRKDGIDIPDKNFEIASIIRTCKLKNNRVFYRCGISKPMLKDLLQATKELLYDNGQEYQYFLYRAIFLTAYYGMFRIGEIAQGPHSVTASDVKPSTNKNKFLLILRSSKTHGKGDHPHTVNIPQVVDVEEDRTINDPYQALNDYRVRRPVGGSDNFFLLQDGTPVKTYQVRAMLKRVIVKANYDPEILDFHSFRVGRASDLLNSSVPFHIVKKWGNWKSNSILRYFKF